MTDNSNRGDNGLKDALDEMMGQLNQLDEVGESLKRSSQSLDEVNSNFPATREFLTARGLTLVSQLDEQGRLGLEAHLIQILQGLTKGDA